MPLYSFFKYLKSNRYTFVTSIIFLLVSLLFSSFGFLATIQGREEIKENTKHFKEDAFIIDGLFPNLSSDSFKEISNIIESNFLEVKETKGLFLFYLDKQTVIILPKERYQNGSDFTAFKDFISTKVNVKRIKFLKEKTK